jgi:hypothetical protein
MKPQESGGKAFFLIQPEADSTIHHPAKPFTL